MNHPQPEDQRLKSPLK